ncbi:helix-turn-helix transcriptional regulator [Sphingobium sufflavum]|uniref:helix-turn-helix transcriptional regulator n=1 Tax=Sphingobium sufflavum TaxID=1129547 RepID=UPI001F3C8377|nr:helix-turn-helix transcriptional regulator [Sphingobium sufflavum]MCE7795465.1 helix-turn-helix transcriptional regulator [Sphingobium sufflavum]
MWQAEDAALIQSLIEGMVEEPLWSSFIDRLRARIGADYTSLVFRPLPETSPQYRVVHLFSGQDSPPIIAALYRDGFYRADPMPYHDLVAGRVYALDELLSVSDPQHELYRRQLLEPSGMNMLRTLRVEEPGGVSAWITASRRDGDFRAEDDAVLAAIAPFLTAALHSYVSIERERTAARVAHEAIARMNFGWLTLDAEGIILDADAQAERMLASAGLLTRSRTGRLTARSRTVADDIAGAIRALAADPHGRPRAIVLNREPWLDMLLVSANARTGTTRPAPVLVAYVHADNWSSADRCDQLCQLFDLIPSEARLALALSRGMSIADAAREIGVTVESARTYSKRIYAKTGARGQADLIRFIHRSVLAIA